MTKKLTLALLILSIGISAFSLISCTGDDNKAKPGEAVDTSVNTTDDETDTPTQAPEENEDPKEPDEFDDTEDDSFINILPSDDESRWGNINGIQN